MKPGFYLATISGGELLYRTKGGKEWAPAWLWYQTKPRKTRPTKPAPAGAFWVFIPPPPGGPV